VWTWNLVSSPLGKQKYWACCRTGRWGDFFVPPLRQIHQGDQIKGEETWQSSGTQQTDENAYKVLLIKKTGGHGISVERLALLLEAREPLLKNRHVNRVLWKLCFLAVLPYKIRNSALHKGNIASFPTLSNSLFTDRPTTRRYTILVIHIIIIIISLLRWHCCPMWTCASLTDVSLSAAFYLSFKFVALHLIESVDTQLYHLLLINLSNSRSC
jgi:hypothetical protein